MPNTSIKDEIEYKLGKNNCFYIVRDVERAAAGLLLGLKNYYIITNDSPYAQELSQKYPEIIIVKETKKLDTLDLLQHSSTKKHIQAGDCILVFKSTKQIEEVCQKQKWNLLNPAAKLASEVEEKISQIAWLGPLTKFLPSYKIDTCQNIKWGGKKFILQFNRSHTGSGTALITSEKQLDEIRKKFPLREARLVEFIEGPLFTNNNVVWEDKILAGNISYQITGLKPFTDLPFATIGNDWALSQQLLNPQQKKEYLEIATAVGKRLAANGWKGLFGIDVVMEQKTGKLYLLEINARQPASTTYESELQSMRGDGESVFAAHLAALLGLPYKNQKIAAINSGAQIIQRVIVNGAQQGVKKLNEYRLIKYDNTKPGSDLYRYQFTEGIMNQHNKIKTATQSGG